MKIVSKFRDYYDSLAYISHDKSLVFVRKPETLHRFTDFIGKNASPVSSRPWDCSSGRYDISIYRFYIGFCGEIYPLAQIVKKNKEYTLEDDIVEYAYSAKDLFDIIDVGNAKVKSLWLSFTKESVERFFDGFNQRVSYFDEKTFPLSKNTAIFSWKRGSRRLSSGRMILRRIRFFRCIALARCWITTPPFKSLSSSLRTTLPRRMSRKLGPLAISSRRKPTASTKILSEKRKPNMKKNKPEKHLPETWARMIGVAILDPDGWRGYKGKSWYAPIDKKEFLQRLSLCTVMFPKEKRNAV